LIFLRDGQAGNRLAWALDAPPTMYLAKIYSKAHQLAFVVLGHCKSANEVILEIDLFMLDTGIKLPAKIQTEIISKQQWQNMVLLKFSLHPAAIFQSKTGSYGDWLILDGNDELLEKIKIKVFKKED
jgi:hypothetical protein